MPLSDDSREALVRYLEAFQTMLGRTVERVQAPAPEPGGVHHSRTLFDDASTSDFVTASVVGVVTATSAVVGAVGIEPDVIARAAAAVGDAIGWTGREYLAGLIGAVAGATMDDLFRLAKAAWELLESAVGYM